MKMRYLIICIFLVFSCDFQRREIKQVITHWMGKEIVFSDSLRPCGILKIIVHL